MFSIHYSAKGYSADDSFQNVIIPNLNKIYKLDNLITYLIEIIGNWTSFKGKKYEIIVLMGSV